MRDGSHEATSEQSSARLTADAAESVRAQAGRPRIVDLLVPVKREFREYLLATGIRDVAVTRGTL